MRRFLEALGAGGRAGLGQVAEAPRNGGRVDTLEVSAAIRNHVAGVEPKGHRTGVSLGDAKSARGTKMPCHAFELGVLVGHVVPEIHDPIPGMSIVGVMVMGFVERSLDAMGPHNHPFRRHKGQKQGD